MYKEKALLVAMSHLSDAQQLVSMPKKGNIAIQHINFAKYLMMQCDGDLNKEIDPDEMWERFLER